jgi:isoleucyl-tRNA synthetase
MEKTGLRAAALKAIDATTFYPPAGQARLRGMIETRPDWLVSRQRAWGVPITVFVHKQTGKLLRDAKVMERVAEAVEQEGADAWFASPPSRFLGNEYDAADYEQVTDILDVWFDSGSTHAFVLEERPDLQWPASLYLEGTDQHRGWFHSSLLESAGTRGRAPYEAVLTHGFTLDQEGRKMSKSLGNAMGPQEIVEQYGADILRLWVVSTDYFYDQRIGPDIMKHAADTYRRLRNTLRFMLGNLAGFSEEERIAPEEMPELDRWVLHRLWALDRLVREEANRFDFHELYNALHNFCTVELSAFYFDIRKDALYCDPLDSVRRRACRTVLDELFSCLTAWLAPVLCFTAEEAWRARMGEDAPSVHRRLFPEVPEGWCDEALAGKWAKIRRLRRVVTGALEIERAEKRIGASLQAAPQVYATADYVAAMVGVDLAEIAITSDAELIEANPPAEAFRLEDVPGIGVVPGRADGGKCERCWMVLPEVGSDPAHPGLCRRCAAAVAAHPAHAAAE